MRVPDLPRDSALAKQLTSSLQGLASSTSNAELARVADDVLKGKRDMRDILRAPSIVEALQRGRTMYEQNLASMSAQQREELDRQSQEQARNLLASDPLFCAIQPNYDR